MSRHLLVVAALSAIVAGPVRADPVADFYKTRTVTLVVGYGTGGGYDVYGRIIGRFIRKYIPGNPAIVVQNMPGAGSLVAANFIYNTAPKDGTVFGIFARELPLMALLGYNPNVRYDPRRFTWLGTVSSCEEDPTLFFARKDGPIKKIEDARGPAGTEYVIASTAAGSAGNEWATLVKEVLGVNLRIIVGYPDSAAIFLAVERAEVQGRSLDYSAVRSSRPSWLAADSPVHVVLQAGRPTRHRDFADVPTAGDLATSDRARALIELADLSNSLARPFAAPPGLPVGQATALQHAFMAATKDPEFLAEAKRLGLEVSPLDSDEMLRRIDRLAGAPRDLLDDLRDMRQKGK
jgi:tripartite-type tricarboxylate transporter receptor subunit TctC